MNAAGLTKAVPANDVIDVQYHHHGGNRGYGNRGHGYGHRGGGNNGAGLAIGLAAGAIIGGAIAASQAQANQNAAYCAQRFRSYDPRSGTYLATNGVRYRCP
jgi:hypothetical protein